MKRVGRPPSLTPEAVRRIRSVFDELGVSPKLVEMVAQREVYRWVQ
jgi:hypothetical protein